MNTATIVPVRKEAPFHAGELRAHELAGGGPPGFAIRDAMPDQHRDFFSMLQYVMLATTDSSGAPVATIVTGPAGFIDAPDAQFLHIDQRAIWQPDVLALLQPGKPVGLLGIDLGNRRRNRANGIVRHIDEHGIELQVTQSFGNCPKYIQVREVEHARDNAEAIGQTHVADHLDASAIDMIAAADTLFVASSIDTQKPEGGVDVSHKGGHPGFVRIDGDTLTIPDFVGNRYFNTLGNLLVDDRAALLFVDFSNGNLLHLQGRAEIVWKVPEEERFDGAERLWRFHVQRVQHTMHAIPLRWTFKEESPALARIGHWR